MLSECSDGQNRDVGIIILGNAGAGKSFICNLLLGDKLCEEDYNPEAVTTATQYHLIPCDPYNIRIYDIPGLIESNQEKIDRNKAQINIAFEQCEYAFVMFVWSERGGRVVDEDIIAFKALREAFEFPLESLMHVVNNVRVNRPSGYDEKFVISLEKFLEPLQISMEDTFFLDSLDSVNTQDLESYRLKLVSFVFQKKARYQKKVREIILEYNQVSILKAKLEQQQAQIDTDKQAWQAEFDRRTKEYENVKKEMEERIQKLLADTERLKTENMYTSFAAGAAGGAAAGTLGGPVGMVVGAVVGTVIAAVRSWFSR